MTNAEEDMKSFLKIYIEEIDRVEAFFIKRYEEYRQEYESLNLRYLHKKNDKEHADVSPFSSNNT